MIESGYMLLISCVYREINDTKKYLCLHASRVDRRRTHNEAQQKSSLIDHCSRLWLCDLLYHGSWCGSVSCFVADGPSRLSKQRIVHELWEGNSEAANQMTLMDS
jgi:hypothetical protein